MAGNAKHKKFYRIGHGKLELSEEFKEKLNKMGRSVDDLERELKEELAQELARHGTLPGWQRRLMRRNQETVEYLRKNNRAIGTNIQETDKTLERIAARSARRDRVP